MIGELLKNTEIPASIRKAHAFAAERHKGQKRKGTKLPYISHPEIVVYILSLYEDDTELLTAAMLHDVVEDTYTTIEEVYQVFGSRIGDLVSELTVDIAKKKLLGKKIYMADHINSMSSDAFTIKLADRLHNVLGLSDHRIDDSFVKWYWVETKYIINNLERRFYTETQKILINRIEFFLDYLEISRQI